jgi:hypothetical protein
MLQSCVTLVQQRVQFTFAEKLCDFALVLLRLDVGIDLVQSSE